MPKSAALCVSKKMVYFNPIFQHLGWSVVESDNSPTVCELIVELIGELFIEDLLKCYL